MTYSVSVYIREFERRGIKSRLINTSLESHFADPALCRANDFDAFIVDRAKKILDAVEKITDREVVGRDSPEIKKIFGTSLI